MKLYNTLTRKIEEFIPYEEGKVGMYTCGPTVYHYAHIGNLRNYIMEDVLVKVFRYLGYEVKRVMNITDVGHLSSDSDTGEDKMLKGAKREHKSVLEIAKMYTDAFFTDCDALNMARPDVVAAATKHIEEYITIISRLLETGYAYTAGGNVYFDVSKLDDYYALTNHKEDDMVVGARTGVEADMDKKNQSDFVLWFTKSKFDDQELKWDSPWGIGYPGWHIECSGISMKYLGEHLDVHCGGVDNIFPHHTNEIAQSEAFLGHSWCKYWIHNEHLNDVTGKMSKSKGEFLTLSLLKEKGYHPLAYRLFCLNSHYRKQLVFTYDALQATTSMYEKLLSKVSSIRDLASVSEDKDINKAILKEYIDHFKNALANDLNTANALTVLYDVLKSDMNETTKLALIDSFDEVLSLDLNKVVAHDETFIKEIEDMIKERGIAQMNKDYSRADEIRNKLFEQGVMIKDTRIGTTYEIK